MIASIPRHSRSWATLMISTALLSACAAKQAEAPAAPASVPAVASPVFQANQEKLVRLFRNKVNLPSGVPISVAGVQDSAMIPNAKEGTLEVGDGPEKRTVPFLAWVDGRYVMFGSPQDVTVDPAVAIRSKIQLEGQPFRGPADAKVTIVEYSDFQCPYCERGYSTLENQVLKEYGDRVKFYFKHFPLPFHPWAEPAAVAAECAKTQKPEAFWAVYRGFFDHQKEVNPDNVKAKAADYLKGSSLDMKAWNECVDQKTSLAAVKTQAEEGSSVGVSGTPAFFINGRVLEGAQPFERFKDVIDAELAAEK